MNLSFYTAATGAQQQQLRLNVNSNNLANINTYGFKAGKPSFATLMYGNLQGINNTELPRGTGTRMVLADTDFSSGSMYQTTRTDDYGIIGGGFFGLQDPQTGDIFYTRSGSFMRAGYQRPNAQGVMEQVYMLSDGLGRFVLDENFQPIELDNSGDMPPIALFDFANTNGMRPIGSNLFLPVDKNGPVRVVENPVIQQGVLESSNADIADEFTKVIEAQRSYGYALKMIQTSDEVESTINGLRG